MMDDEENYARSNFYPRKYVFNHRWREVFLIEPQMVEDTNGGIQWRWMRTVWKGRTKPTFFMNSIKTYHMNPYSKRMTKTPLNVFERVLKKSFFVRDTMLIAKSSAQATIQKVRDYKNTKAASIKKLFAQ